LYADGGYPRYYQGLSWALIQGPLSRFGDTAANTGIIALFESNVFTRKFPSALKTALASLCAAGFRMILTPIDTIKTTLQTEGEPGRELLRERVRPAFGIRIGIREGMTDECCPQVRDYGITGLWFGALGAATASFVSQYPVGDYSSVVNSGSSCR
jgi:hypothetical protein